MRPAVLAMILTFAGPLAPALGEHARESSDAYTGYVTVAHAHRQAKRLSTRPPARAAFRYRKGGLCHHYHYYKPKYPDC